uniref:DUF4050 domain-containing protein n=1 Tax=Triticum urartu TaxID=4572 RepID=A0A8R7PX56_TRIUA
MHMPVDCSWNATYESLLGSTKTFAQPIPLGVRSPANLIACYSSHLSLLIFLVFQWQEMVDFLVDGWEQEGLYD